MLHAHKAVSPKNQHVVCPQGTKSIGFMCSLLAHIEHVPLHINYFSIFLNIFCTYVLGVYVPGISFEFPLYKLILVLHIVRGDGNMPYKMDVATQCPSTG
jgi:hypothetical protein